MTETRSRCDGGRAGARGQQAIFRYRPHRQRHRDGGQWLHVHDRHSHLRSRRDHENDHDSSKGRQEAGVERDVLPGAVQQQQQLAAHENPRHGHDPERRQL